MTDTEAKVRIPLAQAEEYAAEIVGLLAPACSRIEIAGSIRRRRPDVGDIEIVCIPTLIPVIDQDLFSAPIQGEPVNLLDSRCLKLIGDGTLDLRPDKNGRSANGSRYKRLLYRDFGLDLFIVLPPAQWGVLFTIRTGSAEFSHRLVTDKRQGGLMPPWYKVKDGCLVRVPAPPPDLGADSVNTPTEESFFAAIGLSWIPPEERG